MAAEAAVHGYHVAFWVSAGIFALAAVITGSLLRSGPPLSTLHAREMARGRGARPRSAKAFWWPVNPTTAARRGCGSMAG